MKENLESKSGITLKLHAISNRNIEEEQLFELFHKAWGQAKVSPNYVKDVWIELSNKLHNLTR